MREVELEWDLIHLYAKGQGPEEICVRTSEYDEFGRCPCQLLPRDKVLFLQWVHGFAKKRKIDRGKGWYLVNRAMFADFKNRPGYWMGMTGNVIKILQRNGSDTAQRLERIANSTWTPKEPMF